MTLNRTLNRTYDWQRQYEAAILETDASRVPELIRAAQSAINKRIEELRTDHQSTPEEQQAIADALSCLRILQQERV